MAPRFPSFSAAVHQRVFTVIDFRPDQYIEYDEYLCYRYILDYSTHTQRLHFTFNLFDLNGSGRIDRDKLKRTVAILMHDVRSPTAPPQSAGGTGWEAGKEVGGLLELYGYWALQVYDRDGDRSLRWEEWRQYGDEDDRVRQLCDEMSSRKARRRERLLRQALTQPDSRPMSAGGRGGSADKVAGKDEKERSKTDQRERVKDEDGGKRGEQENVDESEDEEMEEDDMYDPAREWEQRYLRDTDETGVWEEYRNRMRTAAGRITTHTMESMEGEALPQPPPSQSQHDNSKRDTHDPNKPPATGSRPGSGGGGGGSGGGGRSPGPTSMSNSGSASSPILNTTRRNLVTIMTKIL